MQPDNPPQPYDRAPPQNLQSGTGPNASGVFGNIYDTEYNTGQRQNSVGYMGKSVGYIDLPQGQDRTVAAGTGSSQRPSGLADHDENPFALNQVSSKQVTE